MATISNVFGSSFVSASSSNDSFIKNLKKSGGAALEFVAVKAVAECEGVLELKRTIFSTGEVLNITAPEYVTVGLEGSDSDVIETSNVRWWNQTLSMATLGATENLMHEYAPMNNTEIGKYFFVKRALPKRGTVAVIKLDAWMGAKVMKGVRIGNFNFDIAYPEAESWTDDSGIEHACQWYGVKATTPSTYILFGIGADDAERDVLLTAPTLRTERFGKEYMNKMFNQMSNLIEGKRYRIQVQTFDRIGHHKGDKSEFTFTDWSLVMDAISTVTRLEMSHEEAVLDRQAVAYQASKNRRTDNVYSQAEKKGEIVAVTSHEDGVTKTGYVDKREFATDADKSKSLEYIYADFKDGVGINLVSINDTRFRDYFIPCYRTGDKVRPAMGEKFVNPRDVRRYRVNGLALVKAEM